MPLQRRLPKRGFTSRNRVEYATINVVDLDFFDDGAVREPAAMFEAGLLRGSLLRSLRSLVTEILIRS